MAGFITVQSIKATVKRWRVSKNDKLIHKANRLADYIKKWEKSGLGFNVLASYFFQIEKM